MIETIASLKLPYKILIQEISPQRSLDMNAYYWGVVIKMIAEYTGYSINEIHDIMGYKFRLSYYFNFSSKRSEYGVVSTTLDTNTDFIAYIEKVRVWALEFLNLVIPDPNEVIHPEEVAEIKL